MNSGRLVALVAIAMFGLVSACAPKRLVSVPELPVADQIRVAVFAEQMRRSPCAKVRAFCGNLGGENAGPSLRAALRGTRLKHWGACWDQEDVVLELSSLRWQGESTVEVDAT